MLKLYLLLFIEYTKIGILAIGGGYAAIPFLFHLQNQYNWFTIDELTNMIAVSNITPGPVGINVATYTGYKTAGILGSLIATTAIVLAPFIMTIIITKLFSKFQCNKNIQNIFLGLRPAACALLFFIAIKLLIQTAEIKNFHEFDLSSIIFFIILLIPFSFVKKNPILTILSGAIGGIIFL